MIEKNKEIVREAYAAISRGEAERFLGFLRDDVEWYFIGSHRSVSYTHLTLPTILRV